MRAARIIADCILFIALFWLPWWLTGIFVVLLLFYFDSFYEIIAFGFLFDALYSQPLSRFYHFQFIVTLCSLVIFVLVGALKRRLRFYS